MIIELLKALLFGSIQGITEFLPVSSSGHLLILHKFLSLPAVNELAFDVSLHLATLLSVIWFFRNDIIAMIKSWLLSFKKGQDNESRLAWQIIIATIPAALAGYFFESTIDSLFRSLWLVAMMLVIVGILFILLEKFSRKILELKDLTWKKSLLVGIAQSIALIPGTSRSGITIITALSLNLKREAAVRFSFLLSIPIIFGAAITKVPDLFKIDLTMSEYGVLSVAFLSALVTGILAIKYFLRYARNHSLNVFAYYRFILALMIVAYLLL